MAVLMTYSAVDSAVEGSYLLAAFSALAGFVNLVAIVYARANQRMQKLYERRQRELVEALDAVHKSAEAWLLHVTRATKH